MEPMQKKADERSKSSTLNQAVRTLNEVAESSAEEFRSMVGKDVGSLRQVFSLGRERFDQVNRSVYQNPWVFIAGAAAVSALFGYMLSRRSR